MAAVAGDTWSFQGWFRDGMGDSNFRGVASVVFDFAHTTHQRIAIIEIGHGHPVVESESSWVERVVVPNRNARAAQAVEVPFPEMSGLVSRVGKDLRKRDLLMAKCVAVLWNSGPITRPTGQHGSARR